MRAETTGFSAVVMNLGNRWVMWFPARGGGRSDRRTGVAVQKPLTEAFNGAFASLPEPFASCSDGAFDLSKKGTGYTVFLTGDQCLKWQWGIEALYQGPIDTDTSIEQLGAVVATTLDPTTDAGVDNITLNETMRRLAHAHTHAGDLKEADIVLDQLVETFRDKDVPEPVLATIVEQVEAARTELHNQA
ncbi:hypothetical protein [Streptosporangium sp. G12]